jgi:hypothetical protein
MYIYKYYIIERHTFVGLGAGELAMEKRKTMSAFRFLLTFHVDVWTGGSVREGGQ